MANVDVQKPSVFKECQRHEKRKTQKCYIIL